jgi:hypothetical protein
MAAGITLAEFGAHVPCDGSTVSRIETGVKSADARFAAVCDELFPKADGWFSRFYSESREWAAYPPAFRSFAADEGLATALYVFAPVLAPGMLQIEEYARAVLNMHPYVEDGQVENRVQARMARQNVLTCAVPPMAMFLLDEAVLRRKVSTADVMYDQLRHLVALSRQPNVSIQILADSIHVGLQGAFSIAEIADAEDRAFIEDVTDGRVVEDPAVVSAVSMRFRHLQTEAMTATASRELIEKVMEEQWKTA